MIKKIVIKKLESSYRVIGQPVDDINSVCTDTRSYKDEDTFLCLYGENFDAFDFIDQIVSLKRVKTIILSHKNSEERIEKIKKLSIIEDHISFILVEDSIAFFQNLAKESVEHWKKTGCTILAITGSNGKTSTKEICFELLNMFFPNEVICTQGNLNNHLGVPLTISRIDENTKIAIIEMGTNHHGEIEVLCNIALPDLGLITNIGPAHLEFLNDLEGVFREKSALYRSLESFKDKKTRMVVWSEDKFLNQLEDKPWLKKLDDKMAKEFQLNSFKIMIDNSFEAVQTNLFEIHNNKNLVQVIYLCSEFFGISLRSIIDKIDNLRISNKNRGQFITKENIEFYLDAYNANPGSMEASLESYSSSLTEDQRKDTLIILGDMNELGEQSASYHAKIAKKANELGFSRMLFIGRYAAGYKNGFLQGIALSSIGQDKEIIAEEIKKSKRVYIKGSRSLQLESILDINI